MEELNSALTKNWKILHNVSSSKLLKLGALTYFKSKPGHDAFKSMSSKLLTEFCQVAFDLINNDDKELSLETRKTLFDLINDETIGELTLYKVGLVINRKKRLKFFTFMENMDTNLWLKFSQNDNKLITFLNDCMQSVNINTMKWLSPQSCTNNINILIEAELNHLKNETDIECQLVFKSMQLLNKLYENTLKNPKIDINKYHTFLFDRIIILVYMGYKQQRKVSLELLTIALKTNFLTHIQDNLQKLWQQYKDNLSKIYCNRMNLLVLSNDYDWATQWSLSIQMLGIDLHRGGAGLINPLLGVEEKAYKSSDNKIRKQAFLCWKVLMDNFSLNPSELSSQRRIKLLCIPLIAKNSKIESLALVKLETWWHLIIKLQPIDTQYLQQVINSFLEFCFGPLGDTPLLSTQIDNNGIIASSAKRFYKTRVLAVDALLQLLIRRKDDRKLITLSLKERLPDAITNIIFKSIYKKLLHSVGEALLLITNLNDDDIKNRDTLCNILWSNLVEYIEESPDDERIEILKELIVVINGLTNHINDSIIISNLIINTIIPEIADLRYTKLITNDDTLIILTKKLLNPTVLKKIEVRHLISIKTLMSCGLKSININTNIKIFDFIDSILAVIENDSYDNFHSIIIEVWCIFASIIIKYINEDNDINEGNDIKHNFKTLFKLIHFPFVCPFWRDITPGPQQAKMISTLWIKLYKLFDMKAHAILTVKPNEILDTLTNTIYKYCSKEKKCYRFVAYCLETIISTIDYKVLFSNNNVPSIIHILRDTTKETLNGPEGELSLKALSLVLMSIYSLADYNKTLSYLEAVKSTIEYMLKIELCHGNIEKEIINTWDTVVIIIKGHSKYLTNNFIEVYHDTFLAAYCHKGVEIVANIMSLKESIDLKPNIKNALLNIEKEAQKIISNQNLLIDNDKKQLTYINNNNNNNNNNNTIKLQKPIKIVGSFLGREGIVNTKLPTTITKIVTVNKDNELKKIIPVNNDSQDYVVINNNNNNNINIDVDFLTEHQKETFKKRRDDIPALYNDLSQSMSHDTQDLKEWFDENRKKAAEKDNNDNDNNKKQDTIVIDEQNESKIINLQTSFDDEKSINVNNEDKLITSTSTTTTTTTTTVLNSINDEVTIKPNDSTSIEENTSDNLSDSIAKKLDFESREEYPDDNEHIDNKQTDVTLKKSDRLLTRGRGRGRSIKPREPTDIENKNLKRKASSDNESDNPTEIKKRKRTSPESSLTSDTFVTSDSDSNHSIDNENQSSSGQETIIKSDKKNLPDQTKRELLRLRINMVSDSYLPGRRRSKLNDETDNKNNKKDTIDNKQNKVRSNKNDKQDKDEESQELTKYRRKRTSKINTSFIKQEETSSPGKRKKNNNDNKEQDKLNCSFEDMSDKSSNVDPNEEQTGEITNNEKTSTTKNQSINKSDNSDHDEVVESSQDKLPTRSPRSIGKNVSRLNSPSTRSSSVPITSTPITNKTTPLINQNDQSTISNSTTKKSPEKSKQTTAPAITTSPKSSKILIKKRPTLPPPSQRRTYQIMDLLKGMNYINNEDLQSDEFTNVSEFVNNKKNKSIETFISPSATKKDRNINLNIPDKINSPSGSRQEKIFNNMKISEIKNTESSVLFSNLKNNGEKISPKLDKTNKLNDDSEFIEIDNNTSTQNDELEFLEWSDANPPSLTASPSASILKRQKSLIETSTKNDRDTSFNKKKRVSFTEPPVSKKMGYLVTSTLKTFPIAKNLLNKKDTSLKIRSLKLKTIQINNTNKTDEISKIKKINDSPIENLTDIAINSQNEYLNKIEDDLENTADINVDIDADETPDDLPVSNNELDTSIKTPSSNNTDILDNEKNINTKEKPKDTLASSFDLSCHDSLTGKFKQSMDLFDPNYDLTNKNKINASDLKTSTPSLIKNSISNRSSIDATDDIAVGKMLHERVLKKGLQVSSSSPLPSTSTSNSSQLTNDINTDKTSKINTVITTIPATPVTDTSSINESITSSQINKTNNSLSQNKILIKTPPIFPNLINCQEPISKIIDDIPTSLWRNPFLKYLTVENIMTVGDLAKKTEFEIFNIPKIKGQKTINYVKQALDDFYTIYINEQNLINNKLQIDETNQSQSVNDIIIENVESIIEPITQDIIEQSSDIITSNDTIDNSISIKNSQLHIDSQSSGDYESMIIDSSIETPKLVVKNINELTKLPKVKVIDTLSPTSQLKHSTLQPLIFKELDLDVIVQHVVKKCSLEQIFGHLKNKMNNMTEEEKLNNIAKLVDNNETNNEKFNYLLQINNLHDGLVKIQNLFSTEKNFIQQVLTTYKNQITSDVCKQSIDDNILKEAICKSCTSSELIKLLTTVLNNEKNNGITVPVNDDLSIDLITKIIDNDKLINTDTVVNKIQENSPNVSIKLFNNIVPETINDTLTNSNMSEDELLTIFKTVSSKLSTDTLLAGFTDVVKQKMK